MFFTTLRNAFTTKSICETNKSGGEKEKEKREKGMEDEDEELYHYEQMGMLLAERTIGDARRAFHARGCAKTGRNARPTFFSQAKLLRQQPDASLSPIIRHL